MSADPQESPVTLPEARRQAAVKLRVLAQALENAAQDNVAPIQCSQLIAMCEQRLVELRHLYDPPLYRTKPPVAAS